MCTPIWAHWSHLANTIELVLHMAHPSPQPKRQIDRYSCFWTAQGRLKVSILYNGRPFPQNCPFSWGNFPICSPMRSHWRHLANTIKLVLPSAHRSPQPKQQIDRFSCFRTVHGGDDSLGPFEPTTQTASAVFAWLTTVTGRHTTLLSR